MDRILDGAVSYIHNCTLSELYNSVQLCREKLKFLCTLKSQDKLFLWLITVSKTMKKKPTNGGIDVSNITPIVIFSEHKSFGNSKFQIPQI